MTPERLLEIMGEIDDKYIEEADPSVKNNIIKINFAALASIAAGVLAIAVVSNYMINDYRRKHWDTFSVGVSDAMPAGEAPAEVAEEYAEAEGEYGEAADEKEGANFDNNTANSYALQGAAPNTREAKGAGADNYAAGNDMPEAVYEAEESMETADSSDDGEALIDSSFSDGGRYTFFADTPEIVLNALKTEAAKLNADTSEYFYLTENSKNILSPEYVRENVINDLSPKTLESESCIYYITQHKDDVLIGYIAIDENGNILENRLEGE